MKTRLNVLARATMLASIVTWLAACQSADKPAATAADTPPAAPTPAKPQPVAPASTPAPASAPGPEAGAPAVAVLEQDVAYGEGRKSNLVGYLAMPQDAAEPLPGVIVIHERWGLNDDIKAITRRLAAEGYVALAVDLYGGETATTPEKAQQLMTEFAEDTEAARRNVSQAYNYLEKYALAPRIGSIGWDLGAGWSLQTALLFPDGLDAMVMYYGSVVNDREELARLKMPMLGFFGSEDKSVPIRDVQTFRTTLNDLGKNADVLIMIGEDHGFASPGSPTYKESVANESWAKTLQFLERNLKVPLPPR